jgi:hypothetical protein
MPEELFPSPAPSLADAAEAESWLNPLHPSGLVYALRALSGARAAHCAAAGPPLVDPRTLFPASDAALPPLFFLLDEIIRSELRDYVSEIAPVNACS